MAKKYLSIEEAARILGLEPKELNRLREKGEIRAFADRGTWKFRHDEIEELSRSLHADSDPEVPIGDYRNFGQAARSGEIDLDESLSSSSEVAFVDEDSLREGDSTVVRGTPLDDRSSDSDVRLIVDSKPDSGTKKGGAITPDSGDSDSDVRLTPDLDDADDSGSDSDVKMVETESQSSIRLTQPASELQDPGSDSDVQLTSAKDSSASLSDSSVRLVSSGSGQETKRKTTEFDERDSDVTLFKKPGAKPKGDSSKKLNKAASAEEEGAFSLDAIPTAEDGSFILGRDDSGISLAEPADSGIGLHVQDSGIELEDVDSGIALDGGGDSGISLETGTSSHVLSGPQDSGIALAGDSGIALEPDESGITLESGDSGIALDPGSGIALEDDSSDSSGSQFSLGGDSGIALEPIEPLKPSEMKTIPPKSRGKGKPPAGADDDDDMGGTIPMMNTFEGKEEDMLETQMEVPFQTGEIEDSDFEFAEHSLDEDSEDTANVINFADEEEDADAP